MRCKRQDYWMEEMNEQMDEGTEGLSCCCSMLNTLPSELGRRRTGETVSLASSEETAGTATTHPGR
jgi:hypothetical protein